MIKTIKRLLPEKWKRNVKDHLGVPSLHKTLKHLKSIGFMPDVVIDGGAYEGHWAVDFLEVFPNAKILMIEAQEDKREALEKICEQHTCIDFYIGLLSSEDNKALSFLQNETASHIEEHIAEDSAYAYQLLKTITLDSLLATKNLGLVNFLKLDVQGHEAEVIKGSIKTLGNVEFCLLEVTLLELAINSVLFIDIINQMNELGFQVYEISQFIRRPFDLALYQMDVLFIKKQSRFIADKKW